MNNLFRILFLLIFGIAVFACTPKLFIESEQIKVSNLQQEDTVLSAFISPYKAEMDQQMNVKIAESKHDFLVARPGSNLMNWMADAVFVNQTKNKRLSLPVFCLLNTGGIRSSIGVGDVKLQDLFKVMPFDNTLVWVKLPMNTLKKIETYINSSGGEPISNAIVENGTLIIQSFEKEYDFFWIITSNYLSNGGDNMSFFDDAIETIETKQLIRDVLIEEAQIQKVLQNDSKSRIR